MKFNKIVPVELDAEGTAIRIFKSRNTASVSGVDFAWMQYGEAVKEIRHKIWLRCGGECEFCGSIINENTMEMHEKIHRGKQGEISLVNSRAACRGSHKFQHKDRNTRFREIKLS